MYAEGYPGGYLICKPADLHETSISTAQGNHTGEAVF